jgi:prevent-host-death family protein
MFELKIRMYNMTIKYSHKRIIVSAYSLAQAKAQLSAVIDAAIAGEQAVITRHGKPVAKIVPFDEANSDLSAFDAHRGSLPKGFKFDRDALNMRR